MQDNTLEKKLQLVQQIRSQYHRNQYDLSNRERILYGRVSNSTPISDINSSEEANAPSSLKFRSALAAMLFIFAILFDFLGIHPVGVEMQQIFDVIATDYQEDITAFVDAYVTKENILEQ